MSDLSDISDDADDLEVGLRSFIALGGLTAGSSVDPVLKALDDARNAIEAKKTTAARNAILHGEIELDQLLAKRGEWWRFVNIHQVPLFGYHIVLTLLFVALGTTCYLDPCVWCVLPNVVLDKVPMAAVAAGGLGAELRGIWFLWNQVSQRLYFRRFLLGQLAAPFVGVLLGILTYLLAKAGLFLVGGQTAATAAKSATVTPGELALCIFVGFKWEWALDRISAIFIKKDGGNSPASSNPAPGAGGGAEAAGGGGAGAVGSGGGGVAAAGSQNAPPAKAQHVAAHRPHQEQ